MALPVWEKTWQWKINMASGGTGTMETDNKQTLLTMVNALLDGGTFTTPCTVWGSCDASNAGNGDSVNRWTDVTKLTPSGGVHSWIVLKLPGIGPDAAVCFDYNAVQSYSVSIVFSYAGFGPSAGGANGTTSARPTASSANEHVFGYISFGHNATYTNKNHLWMSSDGQCIRLYGCRGGGSQFYLSVDKPKNPVASWTTPMFYVVQGSAGTSAHYPNGQTAINLVTSANMTQTKQGGVAYPSLYHEIGYTGGIYPINYWGNTVLSPMDVPSADYPIQQSAGLWAFTAPFRGKISEVYDYFFGPTLTFQEGDSLPADGTCQAYWLGGMILPGAGTSVPLQVS